LTVAQQIEADHDGDDGEARPQRHPVAANVSVERASNTVRTRLIRVILVECRWTAKQARLAAFVNVPNQLLKDAALPPA
jgi:hypothetical protein